MTVLSTSLLWFLFEFHHTLPDGGLCLKDCLYDERPRESFIPLTEPFNISEHQPFRYVLPLLVRDTWS